MRYMLTPTIVPIAYPTTPQTVAEIVRPCSLPGSLFFMQPQNAAAVAGPPIAAFEAIQTSSRSNDGVLAPLRRDLKTIAITFFQRRQPNTVPRTWTIRAIVENNRHVGPMDKADDRLAATPIEAKNDKKKKSLQIVADLEKGSQKSFA
mmetsp:Transcript_20038/g.49862  ORF Transcript_20038/g.49862 Transcript_20038/m.49862 type:complete len:148 (-) Transcript_20038:1081-1524(-)